MINLGETFWQNLVLILPLGWSFLRKQESRVPDEKQLLRYLVLALHHIRYKGWDLVLIIHFE